MKIDNEFKKEFFSFMHEMMHKNKEIFEQGDYSELLILCEQDITILACIYERNEITAKEISIELAVPKTTVVSAVSRLEGRGYVLKMDNANDKRKKSLKLTAKGIKANQQHMDYENAILNHIAGLWKEQDKETIVKLLKSRKKKGDK